MLLTPTIQIVADTTTAASIMRSYIAPIVQGMCALASLACVFFLINGGIQYTASNGKPERMASAKIVIRNAIIGLVVVLAAGTLTVALTHAFHQSATPVAPKLPALSSIKQGDSGNPVVGVILKAITGVLDDIVQSAAAPFLQALNYFTSGTPLVSDNSSVFNLWLAVLGIADALFVLVIALLGFQVMSYATFGLEGIEFKHILPRLAAVFALMNSSVFLIDGFIELSNAMIHALQANFSQASVWDVLTAVVKQAGGYGMAALLIMVAFVILSVILLVYYVGRIVTVYLGAVLSPLILLVWFIPGFRDFAETAAKAYVVTIFVLFVHVVILELAASLFSGMVAGSAEHTADPLMAMIIGLATLVALLKTQGVMMQFSYASVGPRTARKLGSQFINGISYINSRHTMPTVSITRNEASRRLASTVSTANMASTAGVSVTQPSKSNSKITAATQVSNTSGVKQTRKKA